MNKTIKKSFAMLLVAGTLLTSNATVFAANNSPIEPVITKSTAILVKSVSNHQPQPGFSGRLWVTADSVYVRNVTQGSVVIDNMTYGQSAVFQYVKDGNAYYTVDWCEQTFSVATKYLSTVPC
ncbi:hypothetical protein LGL55_18610 [Clostridium tagluense]|uniref:hypothetical protein n=1 Tax=Clostridium tagluense TaxID=360422 RepID=UPI001C0E3162|nr:hypothetical protein [Clostridium tagluense]MBU3129969.1 hypothetical protein [Clostridium tagluense]MCB2311926.1 hypothetical protein [Clostridium tagluense]MCB2317320.1 hypothetical protein [Clostridium tagluense]MCB2322891.1 hypothetical protein [Clostridium tagluense]MCB2326874.1 hypothetical protein [Clostridium tagluense]